MLSRSFDRAGYVLLAAAAALALSLGADIGNAQAQQGAVSGQVVDASSLQPVSGAQVFFPNLNQGSLTDEQGDYRITGVPAGTHEVRVRLLGYRPVTRNVTVEPGATATVDFELRVSAVSLGELVVTQTGEQRTRELGRAVTTIDASEQVQKAKSQTIQDLIKGRSTGTVIRSSSGSVGTGSTFQIRGNTTLSLDNTPLVYIDGVPVANDNSNMAGMFAGNFFTGGQQTSRISDINPEDIASIQVLKGPAATTLYGAEAGSGVIVIETKQGTSGDARWTARAEAGGNWDSTDWVGVAFDPTDDPTFGFLPAFGISPKDTVYMMNLLEGKQAGLADPWRTGFEQNYGGSVRGGFADGEVSYYLSGEYEQLEGNLESNGVTKWNGRANFTLTPSENVDISISNGFTSNHTALPQNDNNSFGYIGNAILSFGNWAPFDRSDPNAGGEAVRTCPLAFEWSRATGAPLGPTSEADLLPGLPFCDAPFLGLNFEDAALTRTTDDTQRYTGSATLTFRPWEPITGRVTVGYDEYDTTTEQLVPVVPRLTSFSDDFQGTLAKAKTRGTVLSLQSSATADFSLTDEIGSSTTAGLQYVDRTTDDIFVECQQFPAGSPACDNSVLLNKTDTNDFFNELRYLGVFGEQQFAWRERVYLTLGLRLDDNSAFGDELSAELFPQTSLSYVISDEEWFPEFFEQFKIRGAWGQSGEQPGSNDAFALLEANPTPFRGQELAAVSPDQPANAGLKPARITEIEAGVDMSILEGRLSGEFTWYRQTTEDDIIERPLPPSGGFPNEQFTNVGGLLNTGVETAVNATMFSLPDLAWDWRAQVSTNYSKVTELDNPIDLGFGQRHIEGRPFASYFVPCVNDDEGLTLADGGAAVFECEGEQGGDPTPNVNGSLSTTVTLFGHVTLYALGEFATGHQLHNNTEEFICEFINRCAAVFETDANGQLTRTAEIKRKAARFNAELNYVEPGDYAKLRTVSLRFDLPQSWTQFFSGEDVSLQVTGENLATFTGYTLDPEMTSGGQEVNGFFSDFLTVPPAKRVTASMQVSF